MAPTLHSVSIFIIALILILQLSTFSIATDTNNHDNTNNNDIYNNNIIMNSNAAATIQVLSEQHFSDTYLSYIDLRYAISDPTKLPILNTIRCTIIQGADVTQRLRWLPGWDYDTNTPLEPRIYIEDPKLDINGIVDDTGYIVTYTNINYTPVDTKGFFERILQNRPTIGLRDSTSTRFDDDRVECEFVEWGMKNNTAIIVAPRFYNPSGVFTLLNYQTTLDDIGYINNIQYTADLMSVRVIGEFGGGPMIKLIGPNAMKFKFVLNGLGYPLLSSDGDIQQYGKFDSDEQISITFPKMFPYLRKYAPNQIKLENVYIIKRNPDDVLTEDDYPRLSFDFFNRSRTGAIGELEHTSLYQPTITYFERIEIRPIYVLNTTTFTGSLYLLSNKSPTLNEIIFKLSDTQFILHTVVPLTPINKIKPIIQFSNEEQFIGTIEDDGTTLHFRDITITTSIDPTHVIEFELINIVVVSKLKDDQKKLQTTLEVSIPSYNIVESMVIPKPLAKYDYAPEKVGITLIPTFDSHYKYGSFQLLIDTSKQVTPISAFNITTDYRVGYRFATHDINYIDNPTFKIVTPFYMYIDGQRVNTEYKPTYADTSFLILKDFPPIQPRTQPYLITFQDLLLVRAKSSEVNPNTQPPLQIHAYGINPVGFQLRVGKVFDTVPSRWTDYQQGTSQFQLQSNIQSRGQVRFELQMNTYFRALDDVEQQFRCEASSNVRFVQIGQLDKPPQLQIAGNETIFNGAITENGSEIEFKGMKLPWKWGFVTTFIFQNIVLVLAPTNNDGINNNNNNHNDIITIQDDKPTTLTCFSTPLYMYRERFVIPTPTQDKILLNAMIKPTIDPYYRYLTMNYEIKDLQVFPKPATKIIFTVKGKDIQGYHYIIHDPTCEPAGQYDYDIERIPILNMNGQLIECLPINNKGVASIECSNNVHIPLDLTSVQLSFTNVIIIANDSSVVDIKLPLITTITIPDWTPLPTTITLNDGNLPRRYTDYYESDFAHTVIPATFFNTILNTTTKHISFELTLNTTNKINDANDITFQIANTDDQFLFLMHDPAYKNKTTITTTTTSLEFQPTQKLEPIMYVNSNKGNTKFTGYIQEDNKVLQFRSTSTEAIIPKGQNNITITFQNMYIIKNPQYKLNDNDYNINNDVEYDIIFDNSYPMLNISISSYGIDRTQRQLRLIPTKTTDFEEPKHNDDDPIKPKKSNKGLIIAIVVILLAAIVVGGSAFYWFKIKNNNNRNQEVGLISNDEGYNSIQ